MNSFAQQNQEQQHSRAAAHSFSSESSAVRSHQPHQFSALEQRANHRPQALHVAQMQQMFNQSPRTRAPMQMHSTAMNTAALASSRPVAQLNGKDPWYKQLWQRHVYGPHHYDISHQVRPKSPELSDEESSKKTYDIIEGHPAPLSLGRASAVGGTTMWIPPFGQIHTTADPSRNQVTNRTVPWKHLLHQGSVTRTAEGENIRTVGTGHGIFPSLNEVFANPVWGSMAYRDRLKTDPEFRKQHYEDVMAHVSIS